jgi:hypothetical protein
MRFARGAAGRGGAGAAEDLSEKWRLGFDTTTSYAIRRGEQASRELNRSRHPDLCHPRMRRPVDAAPLQIDHNQVGRAAVTYRRPNFLSGIFLPDV